MVTKTQRLYEDVKNQEWEYALARYINQNEFTVKHNMDAGMGDSFEGYVVSKDIRDRYVLHHTCPVIKRKNECGKILSMKLDYENKKWSLITRKEYQDTKKGR